MFQQAAHLTTGTVTGISASKNSLYIEVGGNTNNGYMSQLFQVSAPAVGGDLSGMGSWKGHKAEIVYKGRDVSEISIYSDTVGGPPTILKPVAVPSISPSMAA